MEDRQLIERELARFTAAGWRIVSQTETAFQVMYPHTANGTVAVLFVLGPLAAGLFLSLVSVALGNAFFWIAVIVAGLLVLEYLSTRPKLLYITADQLRAPARIEHTARGLSVCSHCAQPTSPKIPTCQTCGAQFAQA